MPFVEFEGSSFDFIAWHNFSVKVKSLSISESIFLSLMSEDVSSSEVVRRRFLSIQSL